MFLWSRQHRMKLHFIQPDKTTQNAFVESLNGRFIDLCSNQSQVTSLDDTRSIIVRWRDHYNQVKPHGAYSSLFYLKNRWLNAIKLSLTKRTKCRGEIIFTLSPDNQSLSSGRKKACASQAQGLCLCSSNFFHYPFGRG